MNARRGRFVQTAPTSALREAKREMGDAPAMEGNLVTAEAVPSRAVSLTDACDDVEGGATARTYLGMCRSDRGEHAGCRSISSCARACRPVVSEL